MLVFFTNVSLMEFLVRYLTLCLLFLIIGSFGWFWIENLHKNIQLMLEFLKGSFPDPTLFPLYINDLPDDVICNSAVNVDDTTLYSKYDLASDLWQQPEFASEHVSDPQDSVTGAESGLLIWMLTKLN